MLNWNKFKIKQRPSTGWDARFLSYMEKFALPECKKGNTAFFDGAQRVFVLISDKQLQTEVASANEALLQDITVKKLIWLSENFRNTRYSLASIYAFDDDLLNAKTNISLKRRRFLHLSDRQYLATLKLGTFTSNGYYREACMKHLQSMDGSLPFLILRMNDWVKQIREEAYVFSMQRMQECGLYEFFQALPMLEKVKRSGRRTNTYINALETQAETLVKQKLQSVSDETLDEIPHYEIQIKNAVYRFINRYPVLTREQMERRLKRERTGYGQMLLIVGIFRFYGYDRAWAEKYLHAKSAVVRYHTLVFRYEQEHDAWEGLSDMLLDSSKRIRGYAAYILEKCTDMNIRAFYLHELDQSPSIAAITGIGDFGTKTELEAIRPFLQADLTAVCKAALISYGKLAGSDAEAVYWQFLFDARPGIAKQAYRCVLKYEVSYGASRLYDAYLQNPSAYIGDYLLHLLLREPSWARLPYLLMLYGSEMLTESHRQMVRVGIYGRRHLYSSVSKQQAEKICGLLEQNKDKLPQGIRDDIIFDLKFVVR